MKGIPDNIFFMTISGMVMGPTTAVWELLTLIKVNALSYKTHKL
jgi:hypothetical protein